MNQFGSQNRNITQIKTQFERGFHQVDYGEEVESTVGFGGVGGFEGLRVSTGFVNLGDCLY